MTKTLPSSDINKTFSFDSANKAEQILSFFLGVQNLVRNKKCRNIVRH